MTLRPALARLERGFRRMWGWLVAKVRGARSYRYDGEQEAHAQQLRETEISLSLMTGADAANPDQMRMASDIEEGAENRLSVLLGKPRLTIAEKRERDAIQAALAARRQSFDLPPHLERTDAPARPAGFMGAVAANPLAAMLMSPVTWVAVAFAVPAAWGGLQKARGDRLEAQRNEARAELAATERELTAAAAERDLLADAVNQAMQQSAQAAETIEAERARRLRAEREARRIRDAMEQARAGNAVDYGFGGVRDAGATGAPGAGSGDTAGSRSR